MDENIGPLSLPDDRGKYSKGLASLIDHEARQIVANSYRTTEDLLRNNVDKLTKVCIKVPCACMHCIGSIKHFVLFTNSWLKHCSNAILSITRMLWL